VTQSAGSGLRGDVEIYAPAMRVGIYIDGYNLYYGGRHLVGGSGEHWKWLDVRALMRSIVTAQRGWPDAVIDRIVYCTARIDARINPDGHTEQDVYLKALLASESVDLIEYGKYVTGVRARPLAVKSETPGGAPTLVRSGWPVMVQSTLGTPQRDALFMVSTLHQEEKGSDVNVASHLLVDTLSGRIDAAVVVSNDTDLRLPVQVARERIPVGLVNPRGDHCAGDLRGRPDDGAGGHWWRRLGPRDFTGNQLPTALGTLTRPPKW
jgi:uncharacterized LabA/DUF88 family protein